MPKRIVDGEGVWRSKKLSQVEPKEYRIHYPWLLPLALANGVFECDPQRVWCDAYSFSMPHIDVLTVTKILDEFENRKLLFRWEENGTLWGYWTGINKPGRLPPLSRVERKHEFLGPEPPLAELRIFLGINGNYGLPMASHDVANGSIGSGSCSGLGSGSGIKGDSPRDAKLAFAGVHLTISERQDKLLASAFAWIDREVQYRRMDSWLEAHPDRRPKSCSRFAHNWLSRIPEPVSNRNSNGRQAEIARLLEGHQETTR